MWRNLIWADASQKYDDWRMFHSYFRVSSEVTPKGPVIVPISDLCSGLSISMVVHTNLAVFTHARIKNKLNQMKGYMHESCHYLSVVWSRKQDLCTAICKILIQWVTSVMRHPIFHNDRQTIADESVLINPDPPWSSGSSSQPGITL